MKQIILSESGRSWHRSKVVMLVNRDGAYPTTSIIQIKMYEDSAKVSRLTDDAEPIHLELSSEEITAIVEQWQEWQQPRCAACGAACGKSATLLRCECCKELYCESCSEEHVCKRD